MHDCRKTKKNLVNLVFGELEAELRQGALADVRSCAACSEEYHSMMATLQVCTDDGFMRIVDDADCAAS